MVPGSGKEGEDNINVHVMMVGLQTIAMLPYVIEDRADISMGHVDRCNTVLDCCPSMVCVCIRGRDAIVEGERAWREGA